MAPARTTRLVILSHPLTADAPVYPGNPPAAGIEPHHRIEAGEADNSTRLALFSHSGTHVDTPWHFDPDGPRAADLPIETFVFDAPCLLDVPTPGRTFIERDVLEPHEAAIAAADLVLLRTGWSAQRAADPARYPTDGPLLAPSAAGWLIDEHPRLRAIATDAISIGSPRFPEASVATHQALTGVGRDDGRFVLIYEDVAMPSGIERLVRVFGWPLFVDGSDGSPVTLVAEVATDDE
ncbi:MAG TPA: cyclase family protein [Candidatus Limnocylindrales bacterium]|nr:cyclase family protein [Candidatus Limnocylindrales bacterium]